MNISISPLFFDNNRFRLVYMSSFNYFSSAIYTTYYNSSGWIYGDMVLPIYE